MSEKIRAKIIMCLICFTAIITGCGVKNNNVLGNPDKAFVEHTEIQKDIEMQSEGEIQPATKEPDPDERQNLEESQPLDNDRAQVSAIYSYLDVDDPAAQALIADGGEDWFGSDIFIKGLTGYTPQSDVFGELSGYIRDREITVKNVGRGLLQSEQLAEVKELILNMMMDILREKGGNIADYQKYFADEAILLQVETYLTTELEEDWRLLESFYLSAYAGNEEEIGWYGEGEAESEGVTYELRQAETESQYLFEFLFYADYLTMSYGEKDKAAALAFNCALSKTTGLIEEAGIYKWYITRENFETSRW